MAKTKLTIFRCARIRSVVRKVFRRHRPIPDLWERFSDPVSPVFSFSATPRAAYFPSRLHSSLIRSSSGPLVLRSDPELAFTWADPVDSLPFGTFHANIGFSGTCHDGDSRVAGYTAGSYSQNTAGSSNDVLSSLLSGLPEPPRFRLLRRKRGRPNLRSSEFSDQAATGSLPQTRDLWRRQAQRNLRSSGTWIQQGSVQVHGVPTTRDISTRLQQVRQVEDTRESRGEMPVSDSGQRNGPRVQRSVSEAVNAAVFSSSPPGEETQFRNSTDTEPWPALQLASRFSSSSSSEVSITRRSQNPPATTFALGGNMLPAQPAPFSTGPALNQGDRQLWSEWSSSSDSRPSPIYLGNGRYRLHDGTIHEIAPAHHSIPENADTLCDKK
jgi:hypothetical protein